MSNLLAILLALIGAVASPLPSPQALPTLRVASPRAVLTLQIANTEQERETGLMSVTDLRPHTGMLFVFEHEAPVEFWMKDTLVPLDMIFVSRSGIVNRVASNVPVASASTPDDKIPRRDGTAKYVIELPAGEAARDAIIPGVHLAVQAESAMDARTP